jgi:membrane-associated phospholipid phosphatase
VLSPLANCRERFDRTAFVVLTSFLIYYGIYMFVPVGGPQYYFCAIGEAQAASGVFPDIGHYLATHTEMRPSPGSTGLFRDLVISAQNAGERPTAAFPSSHVGVATILMFLLWRNHRRHILYMAPFYILLCGATVYIEAHYLVDVLAGWVSSVLVFIVTTRLYDFINKHGWVMRNV